MVSSAAEGSHQQSAAKHAPDEAAAPTANATDWPHRNDSWHNVSAPTTTPFARSRADWQPASHTDQRRPAARLEVRPLAWLPWNALSSWRHLQGVANTIELVVAVPPEASALRVLLLSPSQPVTANTAAVGTLRFRSAQAAFVGCLLTARMATASSRAATASSQAITQTRQQQLETCTEHEASKALPQDNLNHIHI